MVSDVSPVLKVARFLVVAALMVAPPPGVSAAPHQVTVKGAESAPADPELTPLEVGTPTWRGHGSDGPERPWVHPTPPDHHHHRRRPTPAWNYGIGSFNVPNRNGLDAFRLEYDTPYRIFGTGQVLTGLMAGPRGFLYGYAGFGWHFPIGKKFLFSPSTALGLLAGADRTRFGGILQFRTNFELAYRLSPRRRLGIAIQHISNAEIKQPNKGSNTQMLTYTVELGR